MNPLSLAYIGDAVFELLIRTDITDGQKNSHKLHLESSRLVNNEAQAKFLEKIQDELTDREISVVNRARNSKLHTIPKNADPSIYRLATGLEALFGYLYLRGFDDRLIEIYNMGVKNEG